MAQEPPVSNPPTPGTNPPPPPGQYGRRYNWGGGRWFGWGFFWPAVFIFLGIYILLSNLGLLGWLRGDVVWPVLLILLGVALIVGRGRWWR